MTAKIISFADAFNNRAVALAPYDDLTCPKCEAVTEPHRVTEGPTVHYECKQCSRYWRINADGEMLRGRSSNRHY